MPLAEQEEFQEQPCMQARFCRAPVPLVHIELGHGSSVCHNVIPPMALLLDAG